MESIGRLAGALGDISGPVLLVLGAAAVVLAATSLYLLARVRRLSRSWPTDFSTERATELARTLGDCQTGIKDAIERLDALSSKLDRVSDQQLLCVQRVGFIRFDAFEDVGGEQSFSLALLDANNSGVVLSNIYSRSDSRLYAKRVAAGSASHTLSREEEEAVRQAAT